MTFNNCKQPDGSYLIDGVTHDDAHDVVRDQLGFCGCGGNEEMVYVRDMLQEIADNKPRRKAPHDWVIYHLLDNAGFIEHGSILPGWLTQKGANILSDLKELAL